ELLGLGAVRCCSGRGFADALNGGLGGVGRFGGRVAAVGRGGMAAQRAAGAGARGATAVAGTAVTARAARTALLALGARRAVQRRRIVTAQGVALVDPDLDADDAVGGLGLRETVVDVGAQRVQRHAAFAVPLGAGDLDAVQAAG